MKTLAFLPELQIKASGFRMPFLFLFFQLYLYFSIDTMIRPLPLFPLTPENTALPFPRKTIFSPSRIRRSGFFTWIPSTKINPAAAACRFAPRYGKKPPIPDYPAAEKPRSLLFPGRVFLPNQIARRNFRKFQDRSSRSAVIHQYKTGHFLQTMRSAPSSLTRMSPTASLRIPSPIRAPR